MEQKSFSTINPTTGELLQKYDFDATQTVLEKVEKSYQAFQLWRKAPHHERSKHLQEFSKILRSHSGRLASLMNYEMGKPVNQGLAELEKCAGCLEYYAEVAPQHLQNQLVETESTKSFVSYQPLGPILAIMPWNFPFWQVIRALAPQLILGNSFLLKHAQIVTGCALEIENLAREAGLPEALVQTIVIDGPSTEKLIGHPRIRGVTFTGSTSAGKKIAAAAGLHLKKVVLELGGSDAYIVLADCDLEKAVELCASSRLINSGQSCIAAKRFLVEEKIVDSFTQKFIEKMRAKKEEIGPLARGDLRESLHEQVIRSIHLGAKLELGGEIPEGPGFFYPPTVLTNVKLGQPAFDEELFGPVAAIATVKNWQEAVELSNQSEFGLGGAIFSKNIELAETIATHELEVGSAFINTFVKSDSRLPFGGVKNSGVGRELGIPALYEFANIKTVFEA